jgi:transcriptional regulator with XRE-family HTH domain
MPATTLTSPWRELAAAFGSIAELANACGVSPRTIAYWASGDRTPGPIVRAHVRRLAKRRGIDDAWLDLLFAQDE